MPNIVQPGSRPDADPARRSFIGRSGLLSAAAVALLAGRESMAQGKVAARLAADETMHFTVLTNALGRPLPAGALSFGA